MGDVKIGMLEEEARSVAVRLLSPQLTAFFTSAPILASSAVVDLRSNSSMSTFLFRASV